MLLLAALLPTLITGGADESKLHKLQAPRVQYRQNVATATSAPWIDANGWSILRHPDYEYLYDVQGRAAARAAAEAYAYGAHAFIKTDDAGKTAFAEMLSFLQSLPEANLPAVANIGVTDDGSAESGELMNLLARRNLLYRIITKPDRSLALNVTLGSKKYPKEAAANPHALAADIRHDLTDDRRSLRVYGSEVVIARLQSDGKRARVHLLNYADRPVRGLRVRLTGTFSKADLKAFGMPNAATQDLVQDSGATEFTVPELGTYAIIDLTR